MAKVEFEPKEIEDSLIFLSGKLQKALDWVSKHNKTIPLDVPEPFHHSLVFRPRMAGGGCGGLDACGDVGILLAILTILEPPLEGRRMSRPKARGKTTPRPRK